MAVSNVRRTKPVERESRDIFSNLSENNITLESLDFRTVESFLEDYPFENQSVYYGELEYHETSNYGNSRSLALAFEFRVDSNIFILKADVDFKISNFIKELNSISPNQFQIYRSLTPNREDLWNFFRSSDTLLEMTILGPEGEETDVELLDQSLSDISGKYPIESATAVFEFREQQIVTRYADGTINIDSDDPTANEYIIQLFERDVIGGGDG